MPPMNRSLHHRKQMYGNCAAIGDRDAALAQLNEADADVGADFLGGKAGPGVAIDNVDNWIALGWCGSRRRRFNDPIGRARR